MTAPTRPAPRPDDEGRETAGPVTMSEVNVYAAAYLHYVRAGLDDRADVFALREAYWAAYQKLSDRLAALTPHPAPLGATDEGRCVTCDKAADEHENVLGRLFCYPFTAALSGEDSCATFTSAGATDEGLRRVQQEDPMGCGVACLAMVSGRTYAEVRASLSPESRFFLNAAGDAGLTDHTLIWWLHREGYWHRRSWMDGEGGRPVPTSGVALMLTHDAHWVVLADGVVLDPARPEPLPRYDFRQAIEVLAPRAALRAALQAGG